MRASLIYGVVFGALMGVVDVARPAWALRRFGAIELVPYAVALEVARSSAPWRALLVVSMTTVLVAHRACWGADGRRAIADRHGVLVGAMVPVLHVVVMLSSLTAALVVWRLALSLPMGGFLTKCAEILTWDDLAFGAGISVLNAALLSAAVRRFGRDVGASSQRLAIKLLMTFLVVNVVFFGEQTLLALVAPAPPSLPSPDGTRAISPAPWHASSTS